MFPNKRYKIILADPPWRYNDERSNDPHLGGITYPTMSDEEIYTLPIQDISDEDCESMGFDHKFARPDWMIITVLAVPPPQVRPTIVMGPKKNEDDLTFKLSDIIFVIF